jgi:hypothetical protein
LIDFRCFNATFCNISAISWRPVLVVEEAGVPGENHRPWHGQATGKLYHLHLHFILSAKKLLPWVHARLCKLQKGVHSQSQVIKFTSCLPMPWSVVLSGYTSFFHH